MIGHSTNAHDSELLRLGGRLPPLASLPAMLAADDGSLTENLQRISETVKRIATVEPLTLTGVLVQVHALEALYCGDPIDFDEDHPATDMLLAIQIVRGLQHVREAQR